MELTKTRDRSKHLKYIQMTVRRLLKVLRAAKFYNYEFDAHNIDLSDFAYKIREQTM